VNVDKVRQARPNYDFGDTDANGNPMYRDSQPFRIILVLQNNGILILATTYSIHVMKLIRL